MLIIPKSSREVVLYHHQLASSSISMRVLLLIVFLACYGLNNAFNMGLNAKPFPNCRNSGLYMKIEAASSEPLTPPAATARSEGISRKSIINYVPKIALGVLAPLLLGSSSALAAVDPALVGTKKDPAYQKCLSNCMYFCTKEKGEATRARSDCLPECKEKCASTEAQKMKGVPKTKQ